MRIFNNSSYSDSDKEVLCEAAKELIKAGANLYQENNLKSAKDA